MERANEGIVLAGIESPYGTDATPAAATEAIITKGMPTFEVLGEGIPREIPMEFFGQAAPVNIGTGIKLNFTTELKGSGSAGTASRYSPLFRACNFTEAVDAGTDVVYTPNSTQAGESCTLYFWASGTQHKIMGCAGNVKFNFKSNAIQTAEWEFTGLYAADHAATTAFPDPTHEAIAPIVWRSAVFSYNSVATLVVDELTLDMGNTVSPQLSGNAATGIARYFVSQRDTKGTMNPEAVALATLNPWTIFNASTQANLSTAPSASGSGNLVAVAVTGATLEVPKYGERENLLTWDLSFSVNPTLSAGNNECVITFT